jgi:micrococcal nuclease
MIRRTAHRHIRPWFIAIPLLLLTPLAVQTVGHLTASADRITTANTTYSLQSRRTRAVRRQFHAMVADVTDGDTIVVWKKGNRAVIRLAGIDCPERQQPFGKEATAFTSNRTLGKTVTVIPETTDRYERTVADVHLENGKSLSVELLHAGLAWWYRRYSHNRALLHHEKGARTARRGLWSQPNPIPPWKYRRHMREKEP